MNDKKPINIKALAWTVGIHLFLLIILAFWKYSTPAFATTTPEMGMEVNLGTSNDGFGTDQPMDMDDPANEVAVNNQQAAAQQDNTEQEVERTDEDEAPDVAPPVRPVATPRPRPVTTPPQQPTRRPVATNTQTNTRNNTPQQQRPRFVYQGSNGRGGNGAQQNLPGGNEGNTFGDGDRGVPNGTPGASNYTGSPGTGNGGVSHSLSGRKIVAYDVTEEAYREGGKVVIRVTVNKSGNIVNKQIRSATNSEISGIALRKLSAYKFNRSDNAPAEQFGDITIVFKTRN